ncbi:ABC transporter permease [Verticiella sediminum]|uniref:ABC transporter permease n=2 Tax=Verticiella sediminum TaxID=1247510 RepID=A0A556AZ51_9BURK|nr:ABC transporter permease [Verticiella sediminum]
MLFPLLLVIWLSFFSNSILALPPAGYTLDWYAALGGQPAFLSGFVNSLVVALLATLIGLAVSIPASVAIVRGRFPGRELILHLLTAPLTVPAIVLGAALYVSFIATEIATGLPLVGDRSGLVAGHVLLTIPWCIRLITANLVGFDMSIEHAAQSLGASPLVAMLKVTLPVIWPGLVAATLFSFVVSFGNLEVSLFLVSPGQTTLPIAILQYLEWKIDPMIAAVSVVQTLVIAVALLVTDRFVPLTRVV